MARESYLNKDGTYVPLPLDVNFEEMLPNPRTQEMLEQFFRMLGSETRVHFTRNYGQSSQINEGRHQNDRGKRWKASIPNNMSQVDVLRMACGQMFNLNADLIETVTKKLNNPDIQTVATVIEKARIEALGDVWFDDPGMAKESKRKLIEVDTNRHNSGQPPLQDVHLGAAIDKALYDLPGQIANPKWQAAIDKFGADINAAKYTMDSSAALNVAMDIAAFMEWYEQDGEQGGGGDGKGEGEGTENGDGTGTGPGQKEDGERGDTGDAGPSGDDSGPGGQQRDPNQQDNVDYKPAVIHEDGQSTPDNTVAETVAKPKPPTQAERQAQLEATKKRINANYKSTKTRRDKKEKEKQTSDLSGVSQDLDTSGLYKITEDEQRWYARRHNAQYIPVADCVTPIDERTRLMLADFSSNRVDRNQLYKRGQPSRHAWKLNQGNLRVFEQPPKQKGHISILVDISGSMGCWCHKCLGSKRVSNHKAFLTWQVAAALGQLHPTAEVFAYSSQNGEDRVPGMSTAIYPVRAGHQPVACGRDGMLGGTPTCAAMLWFKEHISQRPSNTTAIIITDGGPEPCGPDHKPHVDVIAMDMLNAGFKFGTVFIGGGRYLNIPSEVSINISSYDDISNIQTLLDAIED